MAAIPVSSVTAVGVAVTPAALGIAANAGGDTITEPDVDTFVVVFNGAGAGITVTVSDPGKTAAGNSPTIGTVAVAAGALGFISVGPANIDPTTRQATVTCSSQTSVRVGAFRR